MRVRDGAVEARGIEPVRGTDEPVTGLRRLDPHGSGAELSAKPGHL
jgi:hypothetical protein